MAARGRKLWIPVNGTEQGMFLTGEGPGRPVLLFLHGGPGLPEYWLTRRYPTGWEDVFTVAWWEQRGSAMSLDRRVRGHLTVTQLLDDTLAVAEHLQRRFDVPKVYLVGHSWGSFLGIQAAAREPGLFQAYVGIGQVTDQIRSEARARDYLIEHFRRRGDERMVRRLRRAPIPARPPLPRSYLAVRDRAMHRAGVGTTREMRSVVTGLFLPSLTFDEYSVGERVRLWAGKVASRRSPLWDALLSTDLTRAVHRLAVPAYFLHGRHDYTSSYELAREFAHGLSAPVVGFYTFADSAHSPQFEEPGRTMDILTRDVLNGTTDLADPVPAE
jgi:pimeloyl-ACP methyl ester carboxylesterase